MRIYLETNIWNNSLDQHVEPSVLLEKLDRAGCTPVLSLHVIFELLKTFRSTEPRAQDRGRRLFTHLAQYLSAGLRCATKDALECLVAEMYSSRGTLSTEKFLSTSDLDKITVEISRLASGEIKSEWFTHIEAQSKLAQADRLRQQKFSNANVSVSERLRLVSTDQLGAWLDRSLSTQMAREVLTEQLAWRFPEEDISELAKYSNFLLTGNCRVACGLVKATLYYNWRCANRGSNPSDLLDDIYHVLSASYCDKYATEEGKQSEYASHILQESTQVCIYNRTQPLDEWLLRVATDGCRRSRF